MSDSENQKQDNPQMEHEQPFMSHLIELRDRVLRIVILVLAIFMVLFFFANDLYHMVAQPLLEQLPEGSTMIATGKSSHPKRITPSVPPRATAPKSTSSAIRVSRCSTALSVSR